MMLLSSFQEVFGDTMVQQMRREQQSSRRPALSKEHMPESSFISSARAKSTSMPHVTTTASRDGSQAMKLKQMKMEKEREMAEKRDAALEALNAAAEKRAAEAQEKRDLAAKKKAIEREVKKQQTQEKRAPNIAKKKEIAKAKRAIIL